MAEYNRQEIAEQINRLEDWFGKKLKGEQFEAVVDRIAFIPPKALSEIVDRYIDDNPPSPGKFPTINRLLEGWDLWRREHPEMVAQRQRTKCDMCRSTGFIWASRQIDGDENGIWYEYAFRCPSCENWKFDCNHLSPIPFANFEKLKAMGYRVKEWPTVGAKWKPPAGGLKTIAVNSTKKL